MLEPLVFTMAQEPFEDNLSKQVEEIEALTAIYGDEWHVEDESSRKYYIDIQDDTKTSKTKLRLEVLLPPEYPSDAPPQYCLRAPWLRGENRYTLENQLQEIYVENIGENIVYLWIEKIREFLQSVFKASEKGACASPRKHTKPASPPPTIESLSSDLIAAWTDDSLPTQDGQAQAAEDQEQITPTTFSVKENTEKIPCPEIYHSEFLTDRKSRFQSHLAAVHRKEEVDIVKSTLLENRKIAAATHNIIAYRIRVPNTEVMYKSCEDDGEFGAGQRMLHLLDILNAENVMVVVTRWYGGIHLGPDRFKHINNLARELLHQHGYIKEKEDKKGPRSTKKKS